MARMMGGVLLLTLLGATPTLGQREALVGGWRQQDSELMPLHLDLLPDGQLRMSAQVVVDQDLVQAAGLLEDPVLGELIAGLPWRLQISVNVAGTWEAAGDQLQIQLDELNVQIEDLAAGDVYLALALRPDTGMEMTARLRLTEELLDMVAGLLEAQMAGAADPLAGAGLLDALGLLESLDVYVHAEMAWIQVGDYTLVDTAELEMQINGMDLATFIQQNQALATAVIDGAAELMAAELGLTEEELDAFKADMIQSMLTDFDQAESGAGMVETLALLIDPTELAASVSSGMQGSYVVVADALSITDGEGDSTDWTRVDPASAVLPASWGRLKAGLPDLRNTAR